MDRQRKKELREQFDKIETYMGVIKITNRVSGKIYIAAYPNLKNKQLTLTMQLDDGRHMNSELQSDWKRLGKDGFSFDILEEKSTEDIRDVPWECGVMLKKWLAELEPYGDRGYNKPEK
jgi:hypothetical protein